MSFELSLFVFVAIVVVGWFAAGTYWNVRKGTSAMGWLQDGLPLVGEKTTLRWLGSSAMQLKIEQAKPPFRNAEVLVLLEPRDISVLWVWARLRGRRDLFIFRGHTRNLPRCEFEAFRPGSWSAREVERKLRNQDWKPVATNQGLVTYAPEPAPAAPGLIQALSLSSCPLLRLGVHRRDPNLEVQWPLDHLQRHPARTVFQTLQGVAQRSSL